MANKRSLSLLEFSNKGIIILIQVFCLLLHKFPKLLGISGVSKRKTLAVLDIVTVIFGASQMFINLVKSMRLKWERWNICQLLISGKLLNISVSVVVKMFVISTLGLLIPQSMPQFYLALTWAIHTEYSSTMIKEILLSLDTYTASNNTLELKYVLRKPRHQSSMNLSPAGCLQYPKVLKWEHILIQKRFAFSLLLSYIRRNETKIHINKMETQRVQHFPKAIQNESDLPCFFESDHEPQDNQIIRYRPSLSVILYPQIISLSHFSLWRTQALVLSEIWPSTALCKSITLYSHTFYMTWIQQLSYHSLCSVEQKPFPWFLILFLLY